ncbi:MAG TPA: chromosomal replication initiator protein DnaA [Proteobacteria bacterium]|nr:chromosomal replication initiator protein DnaA [Pseudomonadota bacterium]
MTKEELWNLIQGGLKAQLSKPDYESWVKPLKLYKVEGNRLTIDVPSPFYREWFKDHCLEKALEIADMCGFGNIEFEFVSLGLNGITQLALPLEGVEEKSDRPASHLKLNPSFTFRQFVVGPSNQMAFAAARAVAESPGISYNPLFIYGGTGLGKTHLISAIGNHFARKHREMKVIYTTTESFMMEMINAIMNNDLASFRNRYRSQCDILLMDDIHILAGNKERTREEFFYTFNYLLDAQKQIVFTSDRPPSEIEAEDRLISRFLGGLIVDIRPPDFETRVAILKRKAKSKGISLPEDVAQYLASVFTSNIRELEGALKSLNIRATYQKRPIDRELAAEVVASSGRSSSAAVDVEKIIKAVAAHFSLKPQDLKSRKRSKLIATSRHIAMYLARTVAKMSFPEIGRRFGGKDHSSVIHAVNKISREIAQNSEMRELVEKLKTSLKR